jgi:predicted transposase YdaD
MMHLRDDLSERFERELTALEEDLKMPYVTSVERIAEARGEASGEARGRVGGAASVILSQLRRLCGPLPEGIEERVRKLSMERLESLGEAVLSLRSLQDLEAWLASKAKPAE